MLLSQLLAAGSPNFVRWTFIQFGGLALPAFLHSQKWLQGKCLVAGSSGRTSTKGSCGGSGARHDQRGGTTQSPRASIGWLPRGPIRACSDLVRMSLSSLACPGEAPVSLFACQSETQTHAQTAEPRQGKGHGVRDPKRHTSQFIMEFFEALWGSSQDCSENSHLHFLPAKDGSLPAKA